jgi:hypothetical protein
MKILVTYAVLLLLGISGAYAAPVNIDSLRQQIATASDSLKAPVYTQIAAGYLQYDTIADPQKRAHYQEVALKNTMSALHYYSKYDDTAGLRLSFNNLAKIYTSQKKYSQAKWFILQSNTLSRVKNDVPNIISSLIVLASIKEDIKDYKLAMSDLNEALQLSVTNHYPRTESAVQQSYALLYARMKNYTKEAIALKRHNAIEDSLRKQEEAQLLSQLNASDSVQLKKKPYLTSSRRIYSSDYFTRLALL